MKLWKDTQSTQKPEEYVFNPYKVFVSKNIHFVEVTPSEEFPERQSYWEYDMYEYTPQEYVEVLQNENIELKTELLDTQMALCDIYEAMG